MNRNIIATLMLVLAIGIYLTVTKDVLDQASVEQGVNDQYTSAIAKAEDLLKRRDDISKQFNSVSEDQKAKLDKMIPNTVDNIRLVIDMDNIADKHSLVLSGIRANVSTDAVSTAAPSTAPQGPGPVSNPGLNVGGPIPAAQPTLQAVTITFGVTATYDQFISLMKDLESNLRIMDLTHLSLSSSENGKYTYSVTLQTYWFKAAPAKTN